MVGAIARRELRLLRQDPLPLVLLLAVPVVFVACFKPVLFITLVIEGWPGTNGAEQAVPGAAATFSLFAAGLVGLSFFREHGWGTWDRLRAGPGTTASLLAGKLLPLYAFCVLQLAWLFAAGGLFFGLHLRGSVLALVVVGLAAAAAHVALGLLLVAVAGTIQQANAMANLGTAVLAGLGGALVPLYLLPAWVHRVAPAVPSYWVMRGFRSVTLDGAGVGAAVLPAAVLCAFAGAALAVALVRFSAEDAKAFWS